MLILFRLPFLSVNMPFGVLFKLSLHLVKCLFTQVEHWLNQLCEDLSERICSDLDQNKRIAQTLTLHVSAYKVSFFSSLSEAFNWIFLSKWPFGIFFYTHISIYICACSDESPNFWIFHVSCGLIWIWSYIHLYMLQIAAASIPCLRQGPSWERDLQGESGES